MRTPQGHERPAPPGRRPSHPARRRLSTRSALTVDDFRCTYRDIHAYNVEHWGLRLGQRLVGE
ncbi:hypothetical protein GCM10010276_30830 [Streptomyces longisporus]|uniref:Uncharacterized protein n=1 Tax=Streptomyces longisporus TaxID=1948 RepID=A0ABN3LT29_STRLO